MPLERDEKEERLARIEQILEDIRRQVGHLQGGERIRRDAIATRATARQARESLHREVNRSRAKRKHREKD